MLYEFPLELSSDISSLTPLIQRVDLEAGRIEKIEIEFPDGCVGLIGVRVFHESSQLVPRNTDNWCVGNDVIIEADLKYPFETEPLELLLSGYNEDDTYPHTPRVRITLTPAEMLEKEKVKILPFVGEVRIPI